MRRNTRIWNGLAAPGAAWLLTFFAVPFYAVACVAFGSIDPVFRDAIPQWNPLQWDFAQAQDVLASALNGPLRGVFIRTFIFVIAAMTICFLIGFPIAYFLARHAGKRRLLLLTLIIMPFWVNYLMRMLSWVNLLSPSGLFSRLMSNFGINYNWLDGSPITVVLGLVDASVMPYVTNGNIYAPVMVVAEKAADLILGKTPLDPESVEFYRHVGA